MLIFVDGPKHAVVHACACACMLLCIYAVVHACCCARMLVGMHAAVHVCCSVTWPFFCLSLLCAQLPQQSASSFCACLFTHVPACVPVCWCACSPAFSTACLNSGSSRLVAVAIGHHDALLRLAASALGLLSLQLHLPLPSLFASCPLSACPLSAVRCPLSAVRCPLSAVRCPLSSVLCPLSSVPCPCLLRQMWAPPRCSAPSPWPSAGSGAQRQQSSALPRSLVFMAQGPSRHRFSACLEDSACSTALDHSRARHFPALAVALIYSVALALADP
jgi:hypothetical protein